MSVKFINPSQIHERERILSSESTKQIINLDLSKTNFSFPIAESFLSSCKCTKNANKYANLIVENVSLFLEQATETEKKQIIHGFNDITKYMKRETLQNIAMIAKDNVKNIIKERSEELKVCDRVINNNEKLNKRFDINKLVANSITYKPVYEVAVDVCKLIDTYTIPVPAKLNVAIESSIYTISKYVYNPSRVEILEGITDYFFLRDNIITDNIKNRMNNVIYNSQLLTDEDKCCINYLTTKGNYGEKFDKLCDKCKDEEVKSCICSAKDLYTEKKASSYIDNVVNKLNTDKNMDKEDKEILVNSIFMIPLITPISSDFILSDIKNKSYGELNYKSQLEASIILNEMIADKNDIFGDFYEQKQMTFREMMESSDDISSDDVKDILNKFKAEQEKTPGRFKNMMQLLYKKDPSHIIDETPKLLSLLRYAFILTTATIGPVGVCIAPILMLVDKLISDDINGKQASKLIKALEDEKDKVEDKLNDEEYGSEKYNKLKEYDKCLEKAINKVSDYKNNLADLDNNKDEDEFGDFNFDEAAGLVLSLTESANHNINLNRADIIESIKINIENIVENDILTYSELIVNCPSIISLREYADILEDYKVSIDDPKTRTSISDAVYKLESFKLIHDNELSEAIVENACIPILETAIQESFNLNNVKLMFMSVKKSLKNVNTKIKTLWQSIDANASRMMNGIEKSMTSDRREAIIKGSILPSFSSMIKSVIAIATSGGAGAAVGGPGGAAICAVISALGILGTNAYLNRKQRLLIYDEIDTELQVVEKQLQIAENEGDMNQYRFLLRYQKRLAREKTRIKYRMKAEGRSTLITDPINSRKD